MTITRIEALVFAVDDVAHAARFYTDAGLAPLVETPEKIVLTTQEGQRVVLKHATDASLPAPVVPGEGLREIVWGVADQAGVDRIVADLRQDREVTVDGENVAHSRDETGFGIGFRVTRETPGDHVALPRVNSVRQIHRWNEAPEQLSAEPRPVRIIHLALNIPKADHRKAIDFYLKRLHFKATDDILDTGTFMQCEGDVEHHNFFLCHRPDAAGLNHFALEMPNFDAVITIGNHMINRGWKESRVLGRHLLGSNLYRFFTSPASGRLEFACDMDKMNKTFVTRVWDKNPGHHAWSLKSSGTVDNV